MAPPEKTQQEMKIEEANKQTHINSYGRADD